ncbi:interleukin-8-like [Mustelus asterias]
MNCKITFIALTILMFSGHLTDGLMRMDLRCKCIKTRLNFISPKHMKNIEIIPRGPHCPNVEIITTLKKGKETCLNPEAPWVKMMVERILKRREDH